MLFWSFKFGFAIGQTRRADLIAAASADGEIIVWNSKTGYKIAKVKALPKFVRAVAPSQYGQFLAYGDGFSIVVIRLTNFEKIAHLDGHYGFVTALDWALDGKRLASGGVDGFINVWLIKILNFSLKSYL